MFLKKKKYRGKCLGRKNEQGELGQMKDENFYVEKEVL